QSHGHGHQRRSKLWPGSLMPPSSTQRRCSLRPAPSSFPQTSHESRWPMRSPGLGWTRSSRPSTRAERKRRWPPQWNLRSWLAAQQEAVRTIRAGVKAAEVDAAARAVLRQRHLAHGFIHHTGHGVGFRYHEPIPWLHPSSTQTLTAGMVTSVEPAVYLDEVGGVRVEDNVLVTDAGAEILSARLPRLARHSVSGGMRAARSPGAGVPRPV